MRDRGNHPLVNRRGVGLAILLLFFPGPLFPAVKQPLAASRDEQFNGRWDIKTSGERPRAWWLEIENAGTPAAKRSEERRVGKECRSRWSPDHAKKNKKRRSEERSDRIRAAG